MNKEQRRSSLRDAVYVFFIPVYTPGEFISRGGVEDLQV